MDDMDDLRAYARRKGIYAANLNSVSVWRQLARVAGAAGYGTMSELGAMRATAGNAEGLNTIGCLRKLANAEGCAPVEGLNEDALLSILSNPAVFISNHAGGGDGGTEPQELTNAQKLSLDPSTPVGTVVHVTDGFVISGAGSSSFNGLFVENGTNNGKPKYELVGNSDYAVFWETGLNPLNYEGFDSKWSIGSQTGDIYYDAFGAADSFCSFPWQVVTWRNNSPDDIGQLPVPALTYPAVQALDAPSTAQGGVFLSGGTGDGNYTNAIYTDIGAGSYSKHQFLRLGSVANSDFSAITWENSTKGDAWYVVDNDNFGILYYSLSDVPTPDLATNWKNAADDTPASITFTSVTKGELDAGMTVAGASDTDSNGAFIQTSNSVGRETYVRIGHQFIISDWEDFWRVRNDGDPVDTATGETAFPWLPTWTTATVTRNNVASEENWEVVP